MAHYYKVLNVTAGASPIEIRSAYRKLAMKWHPERNQDKLLTSMSVFKELAEAYEVLSDFDLRMDYDIEEGRIELVLENDEECQFEKFDKDTYEFQDPFETLKHAFSDPLIRGPSVCGEGVYLYDYNDRSDVSMWQFSAAFLTIDEIMEAIEIAKVFPMYVNMNKANGIKQYSRRSLVNGQIVVKQKVHEDGFEILLTFIDGVLRSRTIFDNLFSVTYTY